MKALVFERNPARFAASRVVSTLGSGRGAGIGPLRLLDIEQPALPARDWAVVAPLLSGICGSDLATLDGRSSRYFEEIVSFPFVPGHEVVGLVETAPGDPAQPSRADAARRTAVAPLVAGQRVVLEPVLACAARGIDPPCSACAEGQIGDCERIAFGHISPGLQTGYCADTGGGWSAAGLVAHESQLHAVPEHLSDEDAVVVEPVACAVHAALRAGVRDGETVAVLGAGTLGLAVVASLTTLFSSGRAPGAGALLVGARYPHQRRMAEDLGATAAISPEQLGRAVRRRSGSLALGSQQASGARSALTGGADVVFDCVGSSDSIAQALGLVRPKGRLVLVGMPGRVHVDLAPLWQREVSVLGAYAYGTEQVAPSTEIPAEGSRATGSVAQVRTFDLAFEVVSACHLGRLVSATYPLERFEEAVRHAGEAGRRGSVKIAFDFRHVTRRQSRTTTGGSE